MPNHLRTTCEPPPNHLQTPTCLFRAIRGRVTTDLVKSYKVFFLQCRTTCEPPANHLRTTCKHPPKKYSYSPCQDLANERLYGLTPKTFLFSRLAFNLKNIDSQAKGPDLAKLGSDHLTHHLSMPSRRLHHYPYRVLLLPTVCRMTGFGQSNSWI